MYGHTHKPIIQTAHKSRLCTQHYWFLFEPVPVPVHYLHCPCVSSTGLDTVGSSVPPGDAVDQTQQTNV